MSIWKRREKRAVQCKEKLEVPFTPKEAPKEAPKEVIPVIPVIQTSFLWFSQGYYYYFFNNALGRFQSPTFSPPPSISRKVDTIHFYSLSQLVAQLVAQLVTLTGRPHHTFS